MVKGTRSILDQYDSNSTRLLDILLDHQRLDGHVSPRAVSELAEGLDMSPLDIRETLSFYHFLHDAPAGRHQIYLADTTIARLGAFDEVRLALEASIGCPFGQVDPSGEFGLFLTNCIGLSDQEPAMLVDGVPFTDLDAQRVAEIVDLLRSGRPSEQIANPTGIATTSRGYIEALVASNVRDRGPVLLNEDIDHASILTSCLSREPESLIRTITDSNLRGRGGAGFLTGLKWKMGRDAEGPTKYVIANADEGEPGTFKDRIVLTHSPRDVVVGMTLAGYAIGADSGILYLRYEYWYLKDYLEETLNELRDEGLLGADIVGSGFGFDIRIQMGAGAYVCGDETALIESCEGKRGTPRLKPPYPITAGYLGCPTSVNNVETLANVPSIMDRGSAWFRSLGTEESSGTRLISVSGDCDRSGVYEIEWGTTVSEILSRVGADDARFLQISGPAGECVSAEAAASRRLCYGDLSCNGSIMVFNSERSLPAVIEGFTRFFVEESCGICTPCRSGGVALLEQVTRLANGEGRREDLDGLRSLGYLMRSTSRCGLGVSAPNPISSALEAFPDDFERLLAPTDGALLPSFDPVEAVSDHREAEESLHRQRTLISTTKEGR